jgi:glutamine amidotransferase
VIAIVDYQAGNLVSVKKALDHLGAACRITSDPEAVRSASRIVLPGVGHFATTETLTDSGLREAISQAIAQGVPFLGICVGLQWLFEGSEESPLTKGLGIFPGQCTRFDAQMKVPHVGWNQIEHRAESKLLRGIASGAFAYYTHSYRAPVIDGTVATSDYGSAFAAMVERDRIFGVQFHPEKSAATGLRLLKNFCELPC